MPLVQAPELNWVTVMENMDQEGFFLPDQKAFTTFLSIFKRSSQVGCKDVLYEPRKGNLISIVWFVHGVDSIIVTFGLAWVPQFQASLEKMVFLTVTPGQTITTQHPILSNS